MEKKITRSRNGCFTCKKRRRKCDETKPFCKNCTESGRVCAGYGVRLVFDVDDSRNSNDSFNIRGEKKHGFRGRPKLNDAGNTLIINSHNMHSHVATGETIKQENVVGKIESSAVDRNKNRNGNGNVSISQKHQSISRNPSSVKGIKKPSSLSSSKNTKSHIKSLLPSNSDSTSSFISKDSNQYAKSVSPLNVESLLKPENIDVTPSDTSNVLVSRDSSTSTLLSTANSSINMMSTSNMTKNANSVSTTSDRDIELDFNDPQQFERAFFSGLDYILDNYDNELLNSIDFSFMPVDSSQSSVTLNNNLKMNMISSNAGLNLSPILNYPSMNLTSVTPTIPNASLSNMQPYNGVGGIDNSGATYQSSNQNDLELDSSNLGPQLKKREESLILKHFFEKVIYLLDAHPHNPWPQLMMKFGSMDLAKSCFLSLSSMHLYVNNGGDEFYRKGLLHINNTMEYLIKYVKTGGIAKTGKKVKGDGDLFSGTTRSASESASNSDENDHSGDSNDNDNEHDNGNDNDDSNDTPENKIKHSGDLDLNVPKIISRIKSESNKKKGTNFMVILLLLYVHLLFAVLESGRSALARMFLKLSSSIAADPLFNKKMKKIQQSQSLLCVLSWFDTVAALVSPDCRIPYCDPKWFGESSDIISTDKMNGCPVGLFRVLYDLCLYRRKVMTLFSQQECLLQQIKLSHKNLMDLRDRCLHYRDHVLYILPHGSSFSYIDRLKCAQLWSLAAVLVTIQLELHYFSKMSKMIEHNRNMISASEFPDAVPTVHLYSEKATAIVTEFLSVYNTIPSSSPIITQMVWPIFYVAICSSTEENRKASWKALEILYETVKMGTIKSNMDIVMRVWNEGCSLESILGGEGWFEAGIDLLPC